MTYGSAPLERIDLRSLDRIEICPPARRSGSKRPAPHLERWKVVREATVAWHQSGMPDDPDAAADLSVIFDAIIRDIPSPTVDAEGGLQLLVTALQYDSYLGKYAIGRITRGVASRGQALALIQRDGTIKSARIEKLFSYRGLTREEIDRAIAGDIVAIVGAGDARIGDTIADKESPDALPTIDIEAPTLSMYLGPNTSPFKGREGEFTTGRQIGDRLARELETNVALRVADDGLGYTVSGRGELHLSVLIETMRREGYEFEVGRPQVVTIEQDGVTMEPVEELQIEVDQQFVGVVSQELGARRAQLTHQGNTPNGAARIVYILPTRALIGLRNLLLTATKGTVIMNTLPHGYEPLGPKLQQTRNGVLVAYEQGTTTPYALQNAEARGELFVGPGTEVYAGMIVGQYNRSEDLEVNVCKEKHLTNMRSKSSDGVVQLTPHTVLSLEQCIDFIEDDELLEVTPKSLRLRKRELDHTMRKRKHNQT